MICNPVIYCYALLAACEHTNMDRMMDDLVRVDKIVREVFLLRPYLPRSLPTLAHARSLVLNSLTH